MKFKKTFLAMLALIIVFATMFTLSSCKDKHEHSYEPVTTPAACTTDGVITYTCSCGDTYTETIPATGHTMTEVAAKAATCTESGYTAHTACSVCGYTEGKETVTADHNYSSKITTYPTTATDGVRTKTCTDCGHSETVTINAITFEAPDVAQMIADFIGENQYTLDIDEGSNLIYARELSDYTDNSGQKSFLVISVAEATISGKDGELYGHIKLEMSGLKAIIDSDQIDVKALDFDEDEAESVALYLYVNGSAISVEVTNPDGTTNEMSEDLNELFVEALLYPYVPGGGEESITLLAYTLDQIANAAFPLIEHALDILAEADTPTISDAYLDDLAALGALIGENIVEIETVGTDTVYTLNLEALAALLDEIEGKTVAEYLTEVYGEDVLDILADFFKALPDKTAREIADAAFAFADAAGVSVEDLFTAIEVFVYSTSEVEFSIYEFIEDNADKTLADFLAEASDAEAEDIKSSITTTVDSIYALTIEELLSILFTGDITSADTIIANIESYLTALENAISVQLTFNADGALTAANVIFAGLEINASLDTDSVSMTITPPEGSAVTLTHTTTGEGSGIITMVGGEDDSITLTYSANGITVVGYDGENKILDGAIIATEEGTTTTIEGNLVFDGEDYFDLYAVSVEGQITSLTYTIRGYVEEHGGYYDEGDVWVDTTTETFKVIVDFSYTDNGENETILLTIGDVNFVINHEIIDDMDVVTTVGSVDGDVEFKSELIVSDSIFYLEMGDGVNVLYRAGIEVDEVTGEILAIICEINAYEYDSDEDYNLTKTLYQVFSFEYKAANETDPTTVSVAINGITLTVAVEQTENGTLISVGNGESTIGTIAFGSAEGVYTFAIDFESIAEASVAIGAGKIEVDIDHLTLGTEDIYDQEYVEDDGDGYYEDIYLYTVFKYIEANFGINFTMS